MYCFESSLTSSNPADYSKKGEPVRLISAILMTTTIDLSSSILSMQHNSIPLLIGYRSNGEWQFDLESSIRRLVI
jgi:hypothetical protein